jgi:glycosyltransferase involved in cell wall biosynthesis
MKLFTRLQSLQSCYQVLVSQKIGGAARIALALGRHVLETNGVKACVLGPAGDRVARTVEETGLSFYAYDIDRLTGRSRAATTLESLHILRKTAFDTGVAHFHSPTVFGATRLFRKFSGLKSVLHVHLDFSSEDLRWAFGEPPDLTIVCAEYMRGAVEDARRNRGDLRGSVKVIKNAVDLQRFSAADRGGTKALLGVDAHVPLALIVANLAPHKGQMTCIRAIAELKRRGCPVQLWVVGECREADGRFEAELRAACADLGLGDLVRFLGFRTDTEVLFRAAEFVLLPSTSEGLPLSILEAQASGAVVLAAPTAGIPEVVFDGRTGYLVAADDPVGYASRIEQLLSDTSKMRELSSASRRYVEEEHDIQKYCQRVVAEYECLLAARPGGEKSGLN